MVYEVIELDLGQCREASGALLSQLRTTETPGKGESVAKDSQSKKSVDTPEPDLQPTLQPSGREAALQRTVNQSLNEWEAFARDEYG
ncbi:hypothetical protein FRC01_013370, partial [Tulasnella sp. 417]